MPEFGKIMLFGSLLLLVCCNEDESAVQTFNYDFEEGTEGWTAGFSDYPSGWEESRFEFQFAHTDLPEEVNQDSKALLLSGRNISDDLFMYIKKQISGLKPNHNYRLSFEVQLASQYPEESVGIGGSPGGSVFLKAGGSAVEPVPVEEGAEIRMNINKGNQSQGGDQMKVLGTIGIEGEDFIYELIQRDNIQQPLNVKTDSSGNLWIIIGTDSGFEGVTTLYYNAVKVRLQE
jgi:hypothetical protein